MAVLAGAAGSARPRFTGPVAEVFIAIAAIAGLVVLLTLDVHGKAHAFERGRDPERLPEVVTQRRAAVGALPRP